MRTRIGLGSLAAAALGLLVAAGSAYAGPCTSVGNTSVVVGPNLVANCGFETGDLTSWTVSGSTAVTSQTNLYGVDNYVPNSGSYEAYFSTQGATLGTHLSTDSLDVSQSIGLTVGQQYVVSFYLAQDTPIFSGYTNFFEADFGGAKLTQLVAAGVSVYTPYSFTVTATSAAETLAFFSQNDAGDWLLDDVDVQLVPEPGTLMVFLAGLTFLGLGIMVRRKGGTGNSPRLLRLFTFAAAVATASIMLPSGMARAADSPDAVLKGPIDEANFTAVPGNVRPEVSTATDLGRMEDSTPFSHLFLQLQRSPAREAALESFMAQQTDRASANFHHWLSADELNTRFGVTDSDLAKVKSWLVSQGFKVNGYTPNMMLDVAGTAGNLRSAFKVEMHYIQVGGERHIANTTNPMVPVGLRQVLVGPSGIHDFPPHRMSVPRPQYTFTSSNQTYQALVPGDLQTIYNIAPLYPAGLSGAGQTIVVVEDSNLYTNGDFNTFRKVLGLSRAYPQGNLVIAHPAPATGTNTCGDPGDNVNGDDSEAVLDVEWASAAAPNANIILASCADIAGAPAGFGGFLALQNYVTQSSPPKIVSISYGESEPENGATANLAVNNLFQSAAARGISVFVSSGDEGASSSDANATRASHGINVTGWGDTPYNISVGGTDFEDTYLGTASNYWNATNAANFASAKSYIPEIPWNDTCAGTLFWTYAGLASGQAACNNSTLIADGYTDTGGGSGGPSNCATGVPAITGVASGTCAGYAKPTWQAGLIGNPNDSVRDIPDVSLFASNGFWGHYYVVCYSHPGRAYGGTPCNNNPSTWAGFGGTSVSSPIMAGIQALVNQRTGQSWGNANTVYYALAKSQYGASGNTACDSSRSGGPSASCSFIDITAGDMADACVPLVSGSASKGTLALVGTFNCYGGSAVIASNKKSVTYTYGVLSTSNSALMPTAAGAYGTNTGWDFATGIGSVNAYSLVMNPIWTAH